MILIIQVMMKIIYTLEFQKMILPFQLTKLYNILLLKTSSSTTPQESTSASAVNVQTNSPALTHYPQVIPFYDTSFFKYKKLLQRLHSA